MSWLGSKPHSKGLGFSRSDFILLKRTRFKKMRIEGSNIDNNVIRIIIFSC